jgi:NAD(P)-dependent dehydrogenase (short-subunit alcohol dehydrogenase family)
VTNAGTLRTAVMGLPRLDLFVNNAGMNRPKPIGEVDFDRVAGLNFGL